ncbi:xylulose kinase [Sphingomonas sp. JC676]|uniref:FGGY family carbohydrate kinase n=1 Tax=Sphingomonas sp. JC676 TaxID=2768065 RepID=UPI0016583BA0|nr:FGGY family carbohydrate kinase [Sphingomonas sp. JC676]MBC9033856.1 xylulose kinase [Sphingomonas sp. JC676]
MSGVLVGVDSSTQSCKVLVLDADTGVIVASGSAPHPDGTAVDPMAWIDALGAAWSAAGVAERTDVLGVGVCAQQHGMVAVDRDGHPVHDALLWNDLRSAGQARDMVAQMGIAGWMEAVNVLPVAAITLTKLAWLREHRPEAAARVHRVMLPHDWLVLHLTGAFVTDRSDASGTGYFSAEANRYRPDLLERYFGAVPQLPRVLRPDEAAGTLLPRWGGRGRPIPVSAGAGDNAGAALGLELEPGDVVISVGTSGTIFTRAARPVCDPSGITAGFAAATGDHLPLLCTLNAARVMTATAALLSVDLARFDALALAGKDDAGGLTMLPYFDGERTPDLPDATGQLHGLTRDAFTPENLARGAVLAVANALADCVGMLRAIDAPVGRLLLIGGGAKSAALRAVLPDTLAASLILPATCEYVALGAGRQAAWAATGRLPCWGRRIEAVLEPNLDPGAAAYRDRYARLRDALVSDSLRPASRSSPGRRAGERSPARADRER